jgi:hypothetical protein
MACFFPLLASGHLSVGSGQWVGRDDWPKVFYCIDAREGRIIWGAGNFFWAVASDVESAGFTLCRGVLLVQMPLEAGEHFSDLFRLAQIGDGVGDGVVVFELEQGG